MPAARERSCQCMFSGFTDSAWSYIDFTAYISTNGPITYQLQNCKVSSGLTSREQLIQPEIAAVRVHEIFHASVRRHLYGQALILIEFMPWWTVHDVLALNWLGTCITAVFTSWAVEQRTRQHPCTAIALPSPGVIHHEWLFLSFWHIRFCNKVAWVPNPSYRTPPRDERDLEPRLATKASSILMLPAVRLKTHGWRISDHASI